MQCRYSICSYSHVEYVGSSSILRSYVNVAQLSGSFDYISLLYCSPYYIQNRKPIIGPLKVIIKMLNVP